MKRKVRLPSVNAIVEFFLATVNALQSLSFVTMSSIVDVAIGRGFMLKCHKDNTHEKQINFIFTFLVSLKKILYELYFV